MGYAEAQDPAVLRHYEGLVKKTASLLLELPRVQMERDDIEQMLRMKVWRALRSWDPTKARQTRDRYVFMCVKDQAKDVAKRVNRGELHIEDLVVKESESGRLETRDSFEQRYLSSSHEQTYGEVEDDDVVVPSTLTQLERRIVVLLYRDFKQSEAAERLGIPRHEVERAMRSIRSKMADWKPGLGRDTSAGDRCRQEEQVAA